MRKRILLLLLGSIAFAIGLNAQGNLQFNQAKLVTGLETVPAGKVWKVESFLPTSVYRADFSPNPRIYLCAFDGITREVGHSGIGDLNARYSSVVTFIDTPLWLSAGTTINPTVSSSFLWGVNVLEFNILP